MNTEAIETALDERDEAIKAELTALETKNAKLEERNTDLVSRVVNLEQSTPAFIPDMKGAPKYSISKVMRHIADPKNKLDGFEMEQHQELTGKCGLNRPGAIMVPLSTKSTKSLHYSTDSPDLQASNLVATQTGDLIDILREESIVMGLGAQTISASGDLNIPRKLSGATGYWFGGDDSDSITESDYIFDEVALRPKFIGALTKASYRMLLQTDGTNNAADSMIERDLMEVIAEAIDNAAINGTGSNSQPTGILNQSGILSSVWSSSPQALDWSEILEMEKLMLDAKSLRGSIGMLSDTATFKSTKSTVKSSGDGLGFLSEDGLMNNYPYRSTTFMPANTVLMGNFQDLLIANWGGISLEAAQPGADFARATTNFRAIMALDINVRHPASFIKSSTS